MWGDLPQVLTGDALLSLLSAVGLCPNPSPSEHPALCHHAHNTGAQLSQTNTEGETTACPDISMRPMDKLVQEQKALRAGN